MMHEVVVTVSGKLPFPVDMLRYDGLCPDSERDSYLIVNSITREEPPEERVARKEIVLRRWVDGKRWTPTAGRWDSFGWKVENVEYTGRTMR